MSHKQTIQKRRRRRRNEAWEERQFETYMATLPELFEAMAKVFSRMGNVSLKGLKDS